MLSAESGGEKRWKEVRRESGTEKIFQRRPEGKYIREDLDGQNAGIRIDSEIPGHEQPSH